MTRARFWICGLFALAVAGRGTAADTPKGWERVSSPDGRVSVATPCPASAIETVRKDDAFQLVCRAHGLVFFVAKGMPSRGSGEVVAFDTMLKSALDELDHRFVEQVPVLGRPAFGVRCSDLLLDTPCTRFVDLDPGPPLMVGAFGSKGPGSADPEMRDANTELAKQFYQSLELEEK